MNQKNYIVSVSLEVIGCENEQEAIEQFVEVIIDGRYSREAVKIKEIK